MTRAYATSPSPRGAYTILVSGEQTDGRYCLIDMLVPDGSGPPHRHDFELAKLDLAYVHIMQGKSDALLADIRKLWPNALLVNSGNPSREVAAADVETGLADVAPVARWALANPDFVERFQTGAPFNEADPSSFYGGGAGGYVDYPKPS